jgi:hypothetical protein
MAWTLSRTQGQNPERLTKLAIRVLARLDVEPNGCLLAELAFDELQRTDSIGRALVKDALMAISHCFRLVELANPEGKQEWGCKVLYAVSKDSWEQVKSFLSGKRLD